MLYNFRYELSVNFVFTFMNPFETFNYKDTHRHQGMRKNLIQELAKKFDFDHQILEVMGRIPRHFFLDPAFQEWAYRDLAFPIESDQTISQPFTVAMQTQLLDLTGTEKVLEIGTGSGYQACVLHLIGCKVYSIERQEKLFHRTRKLLKGMGVKGIRLLLGDGWQGLERNAPFDRIIVTAGADHIPPKLVEQLKPGGCMVIPVGSQQEGQQMIKIVKSEDGTIRQENYGAYRFVPMLTGTSK